MNRVLKIILFGFLVWVFPFLFSVALYPLKISIPLLFESLMPVFISLVAVIFATLYFKSVNKKFIREGMIIGLIWFSISILFDLVLFIPSSPMQMSFKNYMLDISITYLIIPIITIGIGYMGNR
jgi:hypothetical protein